MTSNVFEALTYSPRARLALFVVLAVLLVLSFIWISTRSGGETGELRPSGGAAAPSPPAIVTPSPTLVPAQVTREDVVRFLTARNTFSWAEPADLYEKRVVAAGAVPGSQAASPIYSEQSLNLCINERCTVRLVRIETVEMPKQGSSEVTATVLVETGRNGGRGTMPMYCTLETADEVDAQTGLFVNAVCIDINGGGEA